MENIILFPITAVFALFPFLLVFWVLYEEILPENKITSIKLYPYFKTWIIITTPAWLPFFYLVFSLLEKKITGNSNFILGPSHLAAYLLYVSPAAWAIAFCYNIETPLWISIIIIPILYAIGIFTMGLAGWAGCYALSVCN